MSSSLSLEERFEALLKNCESLRAQKEEKEAQNEYLRRQLQDFMRQRRKATRSFSSSSHTIRAEEEREESQSEGSPTEDETFRRPRRGRRQSTTEFKVDIPEFEGKLDPDDFLEWMQTVERIFEYKDVPISKRSLLWP